MQKVEFLQDGIETDPKTPEIKRPPAIATGSYHIDSQEVFKQATEKVVTLQIAQHDADED